MNSLRVQRDETLKRTHWICERAMRKQQVTNKFEQIYKTTFKTTKQKIIHNILSEIAIYSES